MSLTAVYTDLLDSKTNSPKIIERALEYPIESAAAYLTAAPFFKTATQIKWELDVCLGKAVEEIESEILKRGVEADETVTILFNLKTETVKEITIYKHNKNNSKYDASARIQAYMRELFNGFFSGVPKEHVEELEFELC